MEQKISETHTENYEFKRINNITILKDGHSLQSICTGGNASLKITIDYIKNNITVEL